MWDSRWEHSRETDRVARHAAVTVFDRPVVLTAGAGTGKTAALTSRVVAWCLGEGWERSKNALATKFTQGDSALQIATRTLDRVVAITFTEHAAAEMAARIAQTFVKVHTAQTTIGLETVLAQLGPEECQRRAMALSSALDRLRVTTIHAFCMRILATWPLLARLHPHFEVDAEQSALDEVIDEWMAEECAVAFGDPGDADLLQLTMWGMGTDSLREALKKLASQGIPAYAIPLEPYPTGIIRTTVAQLVDSIQPLLTIVGPALDKGKAGKLKSALATIETLAWVVSKLEAAAPEHLLNTLVEIGRDSDVMAAVDRLKSWGQDRFTQTENEALLDVLDLAKSQSMVVAKRLIHLGKLDGDRLPVLCRVMRRWLDEVHRRMRARGAQTFSALLQDTATLLDAHPEVARELRLNIDQLLVDEFQDTDPSQCSMVRHLALVGPPEERPGLFLVGDPKQSIYGWRSADLVAYSSFVDEVCRLGGEQYQLSVNFRSTQAILDEVERIVAPHMRSGGPAHPAFQPLVAHSDPTEGAPLTPNRRPVEHWVAWDWKEGVPIPDTKSESARVLEAAAIARDIVELTRPSREAGSESAATPVPFGKIAILLRSTGALETYLHPLREHNIPFVVERDRNYFRRREVKDAVSLFRVIVDPNDHTALVAVLRSPMVGVPDAALAPLWQLKLPGLMSRLWSPGGVDRVWQAVDQAMPMVPQDVPGIGHVSGFVHTLKAALLHIGVLRHSLRTEPSDTFVMRMRTLFAQEITESARFLGAHRLANLERFYRRLEETLRTVSGGPWAVLNHLRESVQDEREEGEGVPGDSALEAVRIMTIHKAKGLTFDHVYVVGLHGKNRPTAAPVADVVAVPQSSEFVKKYGDRLGERILRRIARTKPHGLWGILHGDGREQGTQKWRVPVRSEFVKKYGRDPGPRILRPLGFGKAEEYREYSAGFAGAKGAKSSRYWGAQLFFHKLSARFHKRSDAWECCLFGVPTAGYDEVEKQRSGTEAGERVRTLYVALTRPRVRLVMLGLWPEAPGWVDPNEADSHMDLIAHRGTTMVQELAANPNVRFLVDDFGVLWRFCSRPQDLTQPVNFEGGRAASVDVERAVSSALILEAHRHHADKVAAGLLVATATAPSHDSSAEQQWVSDTEPREDQPLPEPAAPREHARIVGTAVHAALEHFCPEADPDGELERLAETMATWVPMKSDLYGYEAVIADAQQIILGLKNSSILSRLTTWTLLGREVPFAWVPDAVDGSIVTSRANTLVGAIDLLCWDPDTEELVVVDYKTDRVQNAAEAHSHAQSYLVQATVYREAVRAALVLPKPPRFELWFLQADIVVVLDGAGSGRD